MSHFSTLRTKVTDAEILKQSLSDLGIATKTEADVRGYNGVSASAPSGGCVASVSAPTLSPFSMVNTIWAGLAMPMVPSI